MRIFLLMIPAMLLVAGCMGPSVMVGDTHRMAKYQPVDEPAVLDSIGDVAVAASFHSGAISEPAGASIPARDRVDAGTVDVLPGVTDATVLADSPATAFVQGQRVLSRGDRIMISLRGIPKSEEIKNIIDGMGEVTLPYIGQVRVAEMTPSDAERLIESTYVDRGIYRSINVIVVAEDKVYFVQGEVSRQGKFTMSGDVTLLQAITEAGGYTPFANRRNVKIIRGEQVLFFNAREIANGRETDPLITADDIIVVQRSVF